MTQLLADTHAVLWWLTDAPELSSGARAAIADPLNDVLVSAASVWEIAIKRSIGKLHAPPDLLDVIEAEGFGWLPMTPRHAWAVHDLPRHHGDPFDRLLVAQALCEGLAVITCDASLALYGIGMCW